jgi:hypothetical protein
MSQKKFVHPELKPGEVFLCNSMPSDFQRISWETKRLGEVAYRLDGTVIPPEQWLRPVFVSASELQGMGRSRPNH